MPRMGEALYWQEDGLLQWNKAWDLETKDKVSRIHNSLRAGCEDDLDFALKLFSLYEGQLSWLPGYSLNEWGERHFINEQGFELAFSAREALLEAFTKGKKSSAIRTPNLASYERVRLLMAVAWPDRAVTLSSGDQLTFPAPYSEGVGIISHNSCGNWKGGDKAIVAMMDKGHLFSEGKFTHCPVANFLIRVLEKTPANDPVDIATAFNTLRKNINNKILQQQKFADQIVPVESHIDVKNGNSDTGIIKYLIDTPDKVHPVIIDYKTGHEDYSHDDSYNLYDHNREFSAKQHVIVERNSVLSRGSDKKTNQNRSIEDYQYKFICNGKCGSTVNRIISWNTSNHKPIPLISQLPPNLTRSMYKQGELIELKIDRPILDRHSNKLAGFIALDSAGSEIPLPISELSISMHNDGLLSLTKQKISFLVTESVRDDKYPLVTLLPAIESNINQLVENDEVEGKIALIEYHNGRGAIRIYIKYKQIVHAVTVPFDNLPQKFKNINPKERIFINIFRTATKYKRKPSADLLDIKISSDEAAYLRKKNIKVGDADIQCDSLLEYDGYILIRRKLPHLDFIIRKLYEYSHQLSAIIIDTEETYQAFLETYNEACMVRDDAKSASPTTTKDNVKRIQSNIDYKLLSSSSIKKIKMVLDEAWKIQSQAQKEKFIQSTKEFITRMQAENDKLRTWISQTSDYSKISRYEGFIRNNEKKISGALKRLSDTE